MESVQLARIHVLNFGAKNRLKGPQMDLFIETLTGTAFELRVSPFETIMSVKAKIQRLEGEFNH